MCLGDCSIINSIWVVKIKMTRIRLFSIYYFIILVYRNTNLKYVPAVGSSILPMPP